MLSGNRNFEGRIHPDVRLNYLASPPLVVAYALAGTIDIDLTTEPLGTTPTATDVFLPDLWPSTEEVSADHPRLAHVGHVPRPLRRGLRRRRVLAARCRWPTARPSPGQDASTYVQNPPFFEGMTMTPAPVTDIAGARVLAVLGDWSPPTTSRRPAPSARPRRPGAT